MTAESPGKTLGSTLTVRLPLIGVQAGRCQLEPARPPSTTTESLPHVLQHLHVLAVDDDPDARELVAVVLRRAGAEVVVAASVRDAIAARSPRACPTSS